MGFIFNHLAKTTAIKPTRDGVLAKVLTCYRGIDITDRTPMGSPSDLTGEARDVAMYLLVKVCGMPPDGPIQDFLNCSRKEVDAALARFANEMSQESRYARTLRGLLFDLVPELTTANTVSTTVVAAPPKSRAQSAPVDGDTYSARMRVELAFCGAFELEQITPVIYGDRPRMQDARDALAALLFRVANMSELTIEDYLKRPHGFVKDARRHMRDAACRTPRSHAEKELRIKLNYVCLQLGVHFDTVFKVLD